MKLKPLVTSMVLVGISSTAIAASSGAMHDDTRSQLAAMNARVNKLEAVLDQNQNRVYTSDPRESWFKRIHLSGELNVDAYWSSRNPGTKSLLGPAGGPPAPLSGGARFGSESMEDISVADANLYLDADINSWTEAHLAWTYQDAGIRNNTDHPHTLNGDGVNSINLDEAYMTFANLSESPVYFRYGRQYVPFGTYDRHPMTASFTQLLSETRATAAHLGFVHESGFNAAVYAFRGTTKASASGTPSFKLNNWGAQVAYDGEFTDGHYNIALGYLANMNDVNYVNGFRNNGAFDDGVAGGGSGFSYMGGVDAYSLHADLTYGQFDVSGDYVLAGNEFSAADLAWKTGGAQPEAWTVDVGYSFQTMNHDSRVNLSYQGSDEAVNVGMFGMPEERWLAGYTVGVNKNTDVGFQLYADEDYSSGDGGSGSSSWTAVIRAGVKFA